MRRSILLFSVPGVLATVTLCAAADADKSLRDTRPTGRIITAPRFDPDLERCELFAGIETGTFQTQVIAMGPDRGYVLISNTTTSPLTVELPKSFVAVQVLKQFGAVGFGQNGGPGGNGNQPGLQGNQQGGQQSVGGGFQQQNSQGNQNLFGNPGNGPGAGPGFFSIPPERTIRVSYVSACLEHGKPDPSSRSMYTLVKTADYTQDRVLQELIAMVGSGELKSGAAQAAIWNRSDNMSWEQLAAKFSRGILGKTPYFTTRELQLARETVEATMAQIEDRGQAPTTSTNVAAIRNP